MQTATFTQELIDKTIRIIDQVEKLDSFDLETLTWRESNHSWNVLECIEHLNLYGKFYLPQMEEKIRKSQIKPEMNFSSGLIGGYFAKSMLPKEKSNKMKTFRDKNPIHKQLDKEVIEECLNQLNMLLNILLQSRTVSLTKIKISTSISSLIRINLGDAFQFYINHIIRHLKQIETILSQYH